MFLALSFFSILSTFFFPAQRFAINEAIIILATVLRHFSVTSVEQRDKIKLACDVALASEEGLHLKFSKRCSMGSYSLSEQLYPQEVTGL